MKPKHYPVALALAAFLAVSSAYLNSLIAPRAGAAAQTADWTASLSAERYRTHVAFLASDDMKGRASGSPELERAAEYIAAQFRLAQVQPGAEDGTYFQPFEISAGTEFGPDNSAAVNGVSLARDRDFVPIPFSATAEVEGPVLFAGYGITAPELQWDDYSGVDASGKIVVVFRHEPEELDRDSRFNGGEFTSHAQFINKTINARRHGAKAIVFITDPNNHEGEPDAVGPATREAETSDIGIPAIHATRASIASLFEGAGKDLAAIQREIDTTMRPQSFLLEGSTARISTEVNRVQKTVRNVVGAVRGSDEQLRDEWVVIGAHYDHLGLGDRNSLAPSEIGEIHHGADDNASGTAGILELARLAAANRNMFKRSVLFIAFAAEEIGLLGSAHFVNNPTVPLERIVGMINLDMIGRVANNSVSVIGVGTSPEFRPWIDEINQSVGLTLNYSNSGFGGSDHMSFNSKRIPVLFFFSGLHADYHRPSDTHEKINAEGAMKVLTLAAAAAERIAGAAGPIQFTEVQEERAPGGGPGYGVYFGSVPDFRDNLGGVLFTDVRPGSPAAKAGLMAGDLLVEFDGQAVRNLYDFTFALGSKKPGDVVSVVVQRKGQPVKAAVTLEVRR